MSNLTLLDSVFGSERDNLKPAGPLWSAPYHSAKTRASALRPSCGSLFLSVAYWLIDYPLTRRFCNFLSALQF